MNYLRNAVLKSDHSTIVEASEMLDRLQGGFNSDVALAERQIRERGCGMSNALTEALMIEKKALQRMGDCVRARQALTALLASLVDDGPSRKPPTIGQGADKENRSWANVERRMVAAMLERSERN